MELLKRTALTLIIIGAINWGLIGFFNFDLVAFIFNGQQSFLSRLIYAIVGLSGLYALTIFFTGMKTFNEQDEVDMNSPSYTTEIGEDFDPLTKSDDIFNRMDD